MIAEVSPNEETTLVWMIYSCTGLFLFGVSCFIVLYFQPKSRTTVSSSSLPSLSTGIPPSLQISSRFVNIVCISAVYLSLLCLFTPPVDVFLLDHSLPQLPSNTKAIKILYEIYFGTLVIYSFVIAPFIYNYARQTELAHITLKFSTKERLISALKRTLCFLLGFTFVLIMSMVLLLCGKPTDSRIDWLKPLLKLSSDLQTFMRLALGILVLMGFYIWIGTCSRGLASVPIVGFLMETPEDQDNRTTFHDLLNENAMETQATTQTRDTILFKYATNHQQLSTADQDRLDQLKQREQILNERKQFLEANMKKYLSGIKYTITWLKIPIGLILLIFSMLIIVSVLITSLDKLVYSSFSQGFILNVPQFSNPIDGLLVMSSHFFPLDYLLFGFVFIHLFFVSFIILKRHGLRLLCFRLDRLQPRLTSSSTMTLVSLVLIYLSMVGVFSLLTLAPQYATFGHQKFWDINTSEWMPCTLKEAARIHTTSATCRMSQLAQFYNTLAVTFPMFGTFFFIGQWAFALGFLPWLLHTYCMLKPLPDPKAERLLNNY